VDRQNELRLQHDRYETFRQVGSKGPVPGHRVSSCRDLRHASRVRPRTTRDPADMKRLPNVSRARSGTRIRGWRGPAPTERRFIGEFFGIDGRSWLVSGPILRWI
jgi:hypothetical protein